MRWWPRLLLNENKRSTWARLGSHVSPPGHPGTVGVLLGPSATRPGSQVPLPTAAEDSPVRPDPFPSPSCLGVPITPCFLGFFLPAETRGRGRDEGGDLLSEKARQSQLQGAGRWGRSGALLQSFQSL